MNTTTGWRDTQVCATCKRTPDQPTSPGEWGDRVLPAPTLRTVAAAIVEAGEFTTRVRAETGRPDVTTAGDATVPGGGAEWIWNPAAGVLPQAAGVRDVCHAVEHIGAAVKAVWGETAGATARRPAGVERWVAGAFGELPVGASGDERRASAAYPAKHPTRLSYAQRLAGGRGIGHGLIEGSVKQWVSRRMKRTGARWREHAGPLAELAAVVDTPDWHHFWTAARTAPKSTGTPGTDRAARPGSRHVGGVPSAGGPTDPARPPPAGRAEGTPRDPDGLVGRCPSAHNGPDPGPAREAGRRVAAAGRHAGRAAAPRVPARCQPGPCFVFPETAPAGAVSN